jgi:hypothetical protein
MNGYLLAKTRTFRQYDRTGKTTPTVSFSLARELTKAYCAHVKKADPKEIGRYDGTHLHDGRMRIVVGCNGAGTGKVFDL